MFIHSTFHVHTYQSLLLEGRTDAIKYKDWLDVVVEELADAPVQNDQVSIGDRLSSLVSHSLHSLVQPNTNVWGRRERERWGQ